MKGQVARPGPGFGQGPRRVVGNQGCLVRIQLVQEHFVKAEIAGEHHAIVRGGGDEMGMRTILTPRVHARSVVLNRRAGCAQETGGL